MDRSASPTQTMFLFDDRERFEAKRERERLRGSLPSDLNLPPTADPWKQRPIDFTMVNFHPNRKKIVRAPSLEDISPRVKRSRHAEVLNPAVMKPFEPQYRNPSDINQSKTDDGRFIRDPRIKYEKVQRMLNIEPYRNPAAHDFRQYPDVKDLDIPEFETKFDHDPGNVRFLTAHLNTLWLHERENERVPEVKSSLPEMYRVLKEKPTWESRLVLPKVVYPNKYAAYSRYRNLTRTVQSAYWERVEDHFDGRRKKRLTAT